MSANEAGKITARRNVESIQSPRPENGDRAKRLKWALRYQIAFILLLVAVARTSWEPFTSRVRLARI